MQLAPTFWTLYAQRPSRVMPRACRISNCSRSLSFEPCWATWAQSELTSRSNLFGSFSSSFCTRRVSRAISKVR